MDSSNQNMNSMRVRFAWQTPHGLIDPMHCVEATNNLQNGLADESQMFRVWVHETWNISEHVRLCVYIGLDGEPAAFFISQDDTFLKHHDQSLPSLLEHSPTKIESPVVEESRRMKFGKDVVATAKKMLRTKKRNGNPEPPKLPESSENRHWFQMNSHHKTKTTRSLRRLKKVLDFSWRMNE